MVLGSEVLEQGCNSIEIGVAGLEQQAAQREVQCSPAMFPVGALHDNGFIGDYALKASAFLDRFCHRPFLGLCSA